MPVHLYKQTLDHLYITYMIQNIKQKVFKKLNVLVPQTSRKILDISEIMIFVDKISDGI